MSRFISFAWFKEKLQAKQTYRFCFFLNQSQAKKINKSQFLFNFTHLFYNYLSFLFSQKPHTQLLPLKRIRPEKLWYLHIYVFHYKQLKFPLIGKRRDYLKSLGTKTNHLQSRLKHLHPHTTFHYTKSVRLHPTFNKYINRCLFSSESSLIMLILLILNQPKTARGIEAIILLNSQSCSRTAAPSCSINRGQ